MTGTKEELRLRIEERRAKLLEIIVSAAARAERCPFNRQLAKRLRCGTTAIVNALADLEAAGQIVIERGSNTRVVTICSSGQRTAGKVGRAHWSRRGARPHLGAGAGAG